MAEWTEWRNITGSIVPFGQAAGGVRAFGGSVNFLNSHYPFTINAAHMNNFSRGIRFRYSDIDVSGSVLVECHANVSAANFEARDLNTLGNTYTSTNSRTWEIISEFNNNNGVGNNPPTSGWVAGNSIFMQNVPTAASLASVLGHGNGVGLFRNTGDNMHWNPFGHVANQTATQTVGTNSNARSWFHNSGTVNPPATHTNWLWARFWLTAREAGDLYQPTVHHLRREELGPQEYRPMASRPSGGGANTWHSLNRDNGFLESRNASGNWQPLPLLQFPDDHRTESFPNPASSQSRDASGVWRQQSLIGSE